MCVMEKHCLLLSELETAQTVNVGAFSESAGGLNNVPIVGAMIAYDCERTKPSLFVGFEERSSYRKYGPQSNSAVYFARDWTYCERQSKDTL